MDKSFVSSINIAVRDTELDPYRIAHHSNYAIWSELGVQDYLRGAGAGSDYDVKHFFCKYIASAKRGDEINIRTRLKKEEDKCLIFAQEMLVNMKLIVKSEITIELSVKEDGQ